MEGVVHVIGAGVAGLSAAVRLADEGRRVILYEAAAAAGGRCRSFHDSALALTIDNGNHLLLSGNRAALDYLDRIGARGALSPGSGGAIFPFADLTTGERWILRLNEGRVPWWVLDARRRVPGTRVRDYFAPLGILRADPDRTIGQAMICAGPLYQRLWRPLLLAALNSEPAEASAGLAAAVLRETLLSGGHACHPLIAQAGLSAAFVDPALRHLAAKRATVQFNRKLRLITVEGDRATALEFGGVNAALGPDDAVVLAVPPGIARDLLPDIETPATFRAIVNAHFRIAPPAAMPPMTGLVGGLSEWLFAFPDRLSVTISAADRLLGETRDTLARTIWHEIAALAGLPKALPAWQIVREKRATFAATPENANRRPAARTRVRNLVLAGDWTATGLPATIEGAVRSGYAAAALVAKRGRPADLRAA